MKVIYDFEPKCMTHKVVCESASFLKHLRALQTIGGSYYLITQII
jgi:hypothetical protein